MKGQNLARGKGEAPELKEVAILPILLYQYTICVEGRRFFSSLWRRPTSPAFLKWTAMTVGARSMDNHTRRKRSRRDLYQDSQWVRHPATGTHSLQHLREAILAGPR